MTTLKDHSNLPVTDHKDVEICNSPSKEFRFSVCLVASVLYKLGYQNVSPDLGVSQLLILQMNVLLHSSLFSFWDSSNSHVGSFDGIHRWLSG